MGAYSSLPIRRIPAKNSLWYGEIKNRTRFCYMNLIATLTACAGPQNSPAFSGGIKSVARTVGSRVCIPDNYFTSRCHIIMQPQSRSSHLWCAGILTEAEAARPLGKGTRDPSIFPRVSDFTKQEFLPFFNKRTEVASNIMVSLL